ncbi:unnamed protein product [Brassica oleracea]
MLHYKATRKRIQVLSITTGRAIRKHSSAIWHKRKTMSSHNGTCKDRASMLLMYQTVSYLSEVFHRLQSSSMMIEWLALHIAAASQIEDSYPHFSPLKLGVKLVKRRSIDKTDDVEADLEASEDNLSDGESLPLRGG